MKPAIASRTNHALDQPRGTAKFELFWQQEETRKRFSMAASARGIDRLGFLASLRPSFIKLATRFFDVRPVIPNPI
jgi:hypothetical protein